ncbi:MAG: membrane protein insertase YidC [Oscillospiraceae bacterium]|jgi:YidC/Oxa1 family membrane protein insertase|nr:membrane protein insertase YidC [Oscillospiraceae bacterium]
MEAIFNPIAVPFGWLLMTLYDLFQNYALALLFVAIIVRVIMLPFQMKGKRGMMRQTRLQPKVAELQKKHGANKQKLNEEMAKLYKEEGVNPASGCLWSFIQMPIMIALFYAIRQPLSIMMRLSSELWESSSGAIYQGFEKILGHPPPNEGFYIQVDIAQQIHHHWEEFSALGIERLQNISFYLFGEFINLAETPNWQFFWSEDTDWSVTEKWLPGLILFFFPIISGGAQFVSASIMRKMSAAPTPEGAGATMSGVIKFMPLLSVWFGFILPAALSFYWTIGTVLQIGQDIWLTKKYTKILDEEDAEKEKIRAVRDAELEAKRQETERKKAEGLAERNRNTSKRKKQKTDRQDQREKAAEWEKKQAPEKDVSAKNEPGRIDNRRYARGRAYDPDRFAGAGVVAGVTGEIVDDIEDDDEYEYANAEVEYIDADYEDIDDEYEDDDDYEDYED